MKRKSERVFFWILSLNWGLPMTFSGLLLGGILLLCGLQPTVWNGFLIFPIGQAPGGFSLGPVLFLPQRASRMLLRHEAGHGMQNALLGVFMPFLISLPSLIRFVYREVRIRQGKGAALPPYESIWFENWATRLGSRFL